MAEIYYKTPIDTSVNSLTRDDFDSGPVSVDLIEDNLWLGNLAAAQDIPTLQTRKISHILTLDTCPLPRHVSETHGFKTKFIQIADLPKENIIHYFDECFEFIREGQREGGVLVHCYFGMSRSATIVIAFTMQKYQLPYADAFELVKSKRNFVFPNQGFVHQLKLFEKMNFHVDKNHAAFRTFRLKVAADQVKKVRILPQTFADVVKPDPSLTSVHPEPVVYRCKKCSRVLASQSNIITHNDLERLEAQMKRVKLDDTSDDVCARTYFVEPIAWMDNILHAVDGKLHCPKCKNKVGSFSWIMGCKCPCGMKVSPAFYLVPSKVEWSNVVQNVQVTI